MTVKVWVAKDTLSTAGFAPIWNVCIQKAGRLMVIPATSEEAAHDCVEKIEAAIEQHTFEGLEPVA